MDDPILEAMRAVPRADFLPEHQRAEAAGDYPLPIGHGQTNSQPSTVRDMLRLLEVAPGQRVLDVGSGSGWTTALLAHLVGPDGRVIGVEKVPALVEASRAALAPYRFGHAEIREAGDVLGAPADAPFDRILVSADPRSMPPELVEQLGDGGVLVIPVADVMHRVRRTGAGLEDTEHGWYGFVPLV